MAKVIGSAFDSFTQYNRDQLSPELVPQSQKDAFMHSIVGVIWKFCALGVGTMILSTSMISLWIVIGERVAKEWRLQTYTKMDENDMSWYEVTLSKNAGVSSIGESVGAGGLMAKFSRETDEIRAAASQTSGQMIESLATLLSALILAFISSWSLTFVVLSTIPAMMVMVHFVQKRATIWHLMDMENMAKAGKVLEQSVQAITTVKAFNLQSRQLYELMQSIHKTIIAWNKLAWIYGGRLGVMAWMGLMMFATGFWYGGYLVQSNKATPGQVFTTFWSCVIVGNTVGPMIQRLTFLELGKVAAASLTKIVQPAEERDRTQKPQIDETLSFNDGFESAAPGKEHFTRFSGDADDMMTRIKKRVPSIELALPNTPTSKASFYSDDKSTRRLLTKRSKLSHLPISPTYARPMKRIWPTRSCEGELDLQHITFAYPSRTEDVVLCDISMFIPAKETTFILGQSGSGKSTVSHLLLGLYDNYNGSILLDEQDLQFLDPIWRRSHISAIDQNPIIFDMTVHDNIALGLCGRVNEDIQFQENHVPKLSRKRVIEACKMTLLDADIRKMPNGYDTRLGVGGVDLSGGQKQRLALARAIISDPTVLILDEATSALDIINRSLVMALIRQWRKNKTTIIITHDWKQIDQEDYVYMMESGKIVEHGYRTQLAHIQGGRFARQIEEEGQEDIGKDVPSPTGMEWRASKALLNQTSFAASQQQFLAQRQHHRASRWAASIFPGGGWEEYMTDVVPVRKTHIPNRPISREVMMASENLPNYPSPSVTRITHKQSSSSISSLTSSTSTLTGAGSVGHHAKLRPLRLPQEQQIRNVVQDGMQQSLKNSSVAVSARRPDQPLRKMWSENELDQYTVHVQEYDEVQQKIPHDKRKAKEGWIYDVDEKGDDVKQESSTSFSRLFFGALRIIWTTQPKKILFLVGLLCTILGGCVQPTFSFIMGKLLATMATSNAQGTVTQLSSIVIGLAFADGAMQCLRFALLQLSANYWVESIRREAVKRTFLQDKSWYDREENSNATLITRLIKDPEDAKGFISRIIGEILVVLTMMCVIFVWAIIVSWQLTLAGLALGPIFYFVISIQSKIMLHYEKQNKLQRERVAKQFYMMIRHVREIRAMSLHQVFKENFTDAVGWTTMNAIRSAPYSGFAYGLKDACTYIAQAFLYYIGAILLIKGLLTLASMIIVFNLIIFGITFAANILAYLPNMTKSIKAIHDVESLLHMNTHNSTEHAGQSMPPLLGSFAFHNVTFAYPQRPDRLILDNCSFTIRQGEKVALVGQSGCGKSTIISLLQRLYEPTDGVIVMDDQFPLSKIAVQHLRDHLTSVSQQTDLFDDSIRNNLLLANPNLTEATIWYALEIACAAEFVRSLEKGLDTIVGEKASTISGGQKQRIAIARCLVRQPSFLGGRASIRILDECTSALDPENQQKVLKNLLTNQDHLTTLIVTHKLELMKACDRILVLQNGKVVQDGHYEQLIRQKGGPFSKLANAGEWGA
ncbi:hypothetical protein L7F22_052725 [Adiantum nelumboides]|nr:hypothetical protein [Adiantum nelumboides]